MKIQSERAPLIQTELYGKLIQNAQYIGFRLNCLCFYTSMMSYIELFQLLLGEAFALAFKNDVLWIMLMAKYRTDDEIYTTIAFECLSHKCHSVLNFNYSAVITIRHYDREHCDNYTSNSALRCGCQHPHLAPSPGSSPVRQTTGKQRSPLAVSTHYNADCPSIRCFDKFLFFARHFPINLPREELLLEARYWLINR